jgi:pimeloyl-ACP methyl ester carboxylesterase
VTPFRIAITDAELADLALRLADTRWSDEVEAEPWAYGADPAFMRKLIDYWRERFDWRAQEEELNKTPQLLVPVDGMRLHCAAVRSGRPALLLIHGWPSTWFEHSKLMPLVSAHHDVVSVSLPGYGFSDKPTEPGMTPQRVAGILERLMEELEFDRYAVHGTGLGALIGLLMAAAPGDRVTGLHLGTVPALPPPVGTPGWDPVTPLGQGYAVVQAHGPQTIAYGLNDSPAGLAAWIVEKWRAWSDCGGDVESRFTLDELLTTVSIYWFTQTAASAARIYQDARVDPVDFDSLRVEVPTAVAAFPAASGSREGLEAICGSVRWTEMARGGHFPAIEEPELLAADLVDFLRSVSG